MKFSTRILIGTGAVAGAFCLYYGLTEPLMVLKRFVLWETKPSLLSIVYNLWSSKDWLLAIIIGVFSIAFPVLKIMYLLLSVLLPLRFIKSPTLAFLSGLSRWSMLDVLVVAIVIVSAKTTGLAVATTQPGLWYFTASVVLMAASTLILQRQIRVNL